MILRKQINFEKTDLIDALEVILFVIALSL